MTTKTIIISTHGQKAIFRQTCLQKHTGIIVRRLIQDYRIKTLATKYGRIALTEPNNLGWKRKHYTPSFLEMKHATTGLEKDRFLSRKSIPLTGRTQKQRSRDYRF
jgi:hypothetical protein